MLQGRIDNMKISVVTTLYRSENFIYEFYQRALSTVKKLTSDYEFIFVNDGSPDDSLSKALAIRENDENVTIVDLSRNFGHHPAIMAGLRAATGDYVFLLDVDLEEAPENLSHFWLQMQQNPDHDVVYGVQTLRKGKLIDRSMALLFNQLFNFLSNIEIDKNITLCRLMTRRFVDSLTQYKETELVFVGLCKLAGYRQLAVHIDKANKGTTTYNFSRKLSLAINYITSYSTRPLQLVFYFGLLISLTSLIIGISLVILWSVLDNQLKGWTTIVLSIWFVGGCIMFSMGILGAYLAKIFSEVKRRPTVIVKHTYNKDQQ